jgi:hypothetical protein
MQRTLNDWLLLIGAVLALAAAAILAFVNVTNENHLTLLAGTGIALFCALVAVGMDLQASVTAKLGARANTSIMQCIQGWACLLGWSGFCAAAFQIVLLYPAWASQTFHFDVDKNLLWAGLTVGISAIVIIRSKLAKVGNVEWGFEWVYLWSAAQLALAVNHQRITKKKSAADRFTQAINDLTTYPNFFTDLETHMIEVLRGLPEKVQEDLSQEFERIRATYIPKDDPRPDATVNGSVLARKFLVSAVLDHVGQTVLVPWGESQTPSIK